MKKKKNKGRRRRSLRMKIFELKKFVEDKKMDAKVIGQVDAYNEVLKKLYDIFDMPGIEGFLDSEEEGEIILEENKPSSLDEAKAKARKMFGME